MNVEAQTGYVVEAGLRPRSTWGDPSHYNFRTASVALGVSEWLSQPSLACPLPGFTPSNIFKPIFCIRGEIEAQRG